MVVFLVLSKVAIFLPCQTYLILVILGGHHVMFGNGMPAQLFLESNVANVGAKLSNGGKESSYLRSSRDT